MSEERVSGNIWAEPDTHAPDGEVYVIRNSVGQGWQIPTRNIDPADLRALATRIERKRRNTHEYAVELFGCALADKECSRVDMPNWCPLPDAQDDQDALVREIAGLRAQCAALREREAHLMRELDEARARKTRKSPEEPPLDWRFPYD